MFVVARSVSRKVNRIPTSRKNGQTWGIPFSFSGQALATSAYEMDDFQAVAFF
jgi:hypothetical protein